MAVTIEGAFTVPAGQELVWTKLNDPDVLKSCISGCRTLEKTSDTNFVATAGMKLGPVRVSIKGNFDLHDVDPPHSCRLVGGGQGGLAGFAKGVAFIRLHAVPEGTTVTYSVEADVGGKIAHLGGRLVDSVAKRIVDQFFVRFTAAAVPSVTAA